MSVLGWIPKNQSGSYGYKPQSGWFEYLILEVLTWVFVLGTVATISWSQAGSALYTLAIALGAAAVSLIRRSTLRRLTAFTVFIEIITLMLMVAVLSNPATRGMEGILGALVAWVVIEALRHRVRQTTTPLTNLVTFALLIPVALLLDGRSGPDVSTLGILALWVGLEAVWMVADQRWFQGFRWPLRLTRWQKWVVGIAGLGLVALFVAQAIRNVTTITYHGRVTTMDTLIDRFEPLYCASTPWRIGGIHLSWIGFNSATCFDSEEEMLDYSSSQR